MFPSYVHVDRSYTGVSGCNTLISRIHHRKNAKIDGTSLSVLTPLRRREERGSALYNRERQGSKLERTDKGAKTEGS